MFAEIKSRYIFEVLKQSKMNTELRAGMRLFSKELNCFHIIKTVTEKKVAYTPEIPTGGLKTNKNTIRVFTTSVRKANEWLASGSWAINS